MGTIQMQQHLNDLEEKLREGNNQLERVFEECYVVPKSARHPQGYQAGAGGARTGMMHATRPLHNLERAIGSIVSDLPNSDVPSELEEAVNKLCDGFLVLLPFFVNRASADLRN